MFTIVRDVNGHPYSHSEVARRISAAGRTSISPTYVLQLRRGRRPNPTKDHPKALATFFGVPTASLLDDDDTLRIDAELELLTALHDPAVRNLATGPEVHPTTA